MSAAATGTSGNPIVGPHCPTTDGPATALAPARIDGAAWPLAEGPAVALAPARIDGATWPLADGPAGAPRRAPVRTILPAATERARTGETDNTVNRTARTARGIHATFLSVAFACQRPY